MRRFVSFIAVAAITLLAVGCGPAFLPSPTKKKVTAQDVVGTWSFPVNYGKGTVVMTFLSSGEFTEAIPAVKGQLAIHRGAWLLDGSSVQLRGFVDQFNGVMATNDVSWYIVDGQDRLEVFGGESQDPDQWASLKYLGPVE